MSLGAPQAWGELSTLHSSVRALGMGDAYTAIVDNSDSLFYNPAGLAKVSGINWKIFDVRAGASGVDALTDLQDVNSDEGFATGLNALYGDHVWAGAGAESAITVPMFGFAIYNHFDALLKVDNPVNPEVYTSVINDYGYVFGFGVPIGPFVQTGMNFRYVKRTGARTPFGPTFIADLNPDEIYNNVTGWGVGYGADAGLNFLIPTPVFGFSVAATWRNIGRLSFRSEDPSANIPYEENDVGVGLGFVFDTPLLAIRPAIDFRYINREDLQLTRKINFGVEFDLPIIDIRGGFREGYWTAGAGINLGLLHVDVASYGVELGEYPGQIEDRRYVASVSIELGVGNFSVVDASGGSSSSGGKSGKGSSSSKSSGSKAMWGSRKLKQRR